MDKPKPRKNALGRGLNALLEDSLFIAPPRSALPSNTQELPVEVIQQNPFQPRKDFDETALQELSASIRVHGVIQPLTVKKIDDHTYQLIAGERRLRAAKLAGLTHVPAYIRVADDQQMLEMAIIENIQRTNLNPIEIALSYQRLLAECHINQEELGDRVGKNRTTVTNYLRLLKLPPDIQIALRDQKLSMGHARALISVEKVETQLKLFKKIIEEGLSVRKVEALTRLLTEKKPFSARPLPDMEIKKALDSLKEKLSLRLDTKVTIRTNEQEQGEIKISFESAQDLARIIEALSL